MDRASESRLFQSLKLVRRRKGKIGAILLLGLFALMLSVPLLGLSSINPQTRENDIQPEELFSMAEEPETGAVEFTEHGSKTYLGNNKWRYRSSVGETNTWNGSHYLRYNYDLENKQVSIGKLTFTHGANGVISVSHSETGSMIGELKWYAQYYLSDQWNNFTFDNYEYLGATKNDENATVYQRWWSTNGELNVSYTYYYWNELKMQATATNWAAQTVPVRVLWAMTDIRLAGVEYSLIYDNGVAVGVKIGNEQSIYWHDVTESAPEININPVLDKENRRAAVVFGNMSSVLAQYETMDIDPTYTVAADEDDAYADYWGGGFTLYGSGTADYIQYIGVINHDYHTFIRLDLDIETTEIIDASLYGYEESDSGTNTHRAWRIAGTDWTTAPESLSARPNLDDSVPYVEWDSDGSAAAWVEVNVTDLVTDLINEAGSPYSGYIGFELNRTVNNVNSYQWQDYQHAGTNQAYLEVDFIGPSEDFVDKISDLHDPSDIGTHSDFQEEKDKDGVYDTLTEVDIVEIPSEWKYVDGISTAEIVWTTAGASPYLNAQDQPTNRIYTGSNGAVSSWYTLADTSGYSSGSDTFAVNASVYWRAISDSYVEWEVDWTSDGTADASGSFTTHASYSWDNTGTLSGLDTVSEINQARIRFIHNKGGGGPEQVDVDAARIGIAETGTNYELDLEVGWITADYDETSEELCIFGGTQGSEALRVDVWSGSWTNVFTDIAAGWNNISVASYLTDATFEIRFTDTTNESVLADTWQIEAVLLHTWSGGAAHEKDLTETVTAAETIENAASYDRAYTESISAADVRTTVADMARNLVEAIGVVGVLTMLRGREKDLVETISVADVRNFSVDYARGLVETISVFDVWSKTFGLNRSEAISAVDTIESQKAIAKNLTETIGVVDSWSRSVGYSRGLTESISVVDVRTLSAAFVRDLVEAISVLDTIDTSKFISKKMTETITVADVRLLSADFVRDLVEAITVLETIDAQRLGGNDYEKNLTENITVYTWITWDTHGGTWVGASLIYQLFFSLEMWGYLGVIAIVIGGYFVSRKDIYLGIIWFMVECLIVAQYILLVEATPDYWWQIFILLIGGMLTCVYPLWEKR